MLCQDTTNQTDRCSYSWVTIKNTKPLTYIKNIISKTKFPSTSIEMLLSQTVYTWMVGILSLGCSFRAIQRALLFAISAGLGDTTPEWTGAPGHLQGLLVGTLMSRAGWVWDGGHIIYLPNVKTLKGERGAVTNNAGMNWDHSVQSGFCVPQIKGKWNERPLAPSRECVPI